MQQIDQHRAPEHQGHELAQPEKRFHGTPPKTSCAGEHTRQPAAAPAMNENGGFDAPVLLRAACVIRA
ncbi:Uncharacterised protein [Acinetobacter baumannii]|nr:Uncharacterised protein [Acinetobacter baumannii]